MYCSQIYFKKLATSRKQKKSNFPFFKEENDPVSGLPSGTLMSKCALGPYLSLSLPPPPSCLGERVYFRSVIFKVILALLVVINPLFLRSWRMIRALIVTERF